MTNFARVAAAVFLCSAVGCATLDDKPGGEVSSDGAQLTAVIDAVKRAIVEAQTREVAGFPELKKIAVKLQTTVSRSASGGVNYLVVAASGTASSDSVSTLELDLKPPEIRPRAGITGETLEDALAAAIRLAKVGVAEATHGDPPLPVKAVSIDLKFAVSVQGSAGVNVKLVPVGLSGSAKTSKGSVHSVTLTFGG